MSHKKNQHMTHLGVKNQEDAIKRIRESVSSLNDEEHLIRSCIFDLHAVVETELRRIYFFHFQTLLPLSDDKKNNRKIKDHFEKMIAGRNFGDMWRVLKPVIIEWSKDFESIEEINNVRNKAAHGVIDKVIYKNRNPFKDPDCLCQILCDVEGITDGMGRLFDYIRKPILKWRTYNKKYGELAITQEAIDEVNKFYNEH